jgi:hypothetical protein
MQEQKQRQMQEQKQRQPQEQKQRQPQRQEQKQRRNAGPSTPLRFAQDDARFGCAGLRDKRAFGRSSYNKRR